MYIKNLSLEHFRNYRKASWEISSEVTIISGPNGIGKTNILEAISVLSHGKSHKAVLERNLINLEAEYARVVGNFSGDIRQEIVLQRKQHSNRIKKTFKVNGVIKTGYSFVGNVKTVLFSPEDIRLVAGSPARRREYLDRLLSQVHRDYYKNLLLYNKTLRHRNKLLEQIHGQVIQLSAVHATQLEFWDSQLVKAGQIIQNIRSNFFAYAKKQLSSISKTLYSEGYQLELVYRRNEINNTEIEKARKVEILKGVTSLGPHLDDFIFLLSRKNRLNLKGYGSRGQQRTGVLCMKVLEIKYIAALSSKKPILLLDDIFSELDSDYRGFVESVVNSQQTIITTADLHSVPDSIHKRAEIVGLGLR